MYPSYVDKERSIKDGRRVKVECACMIVTGTVNNIGENPSTMDVMNACTKLGLDCLLEPKRYPKAWWVFGRCRIRLHNPDGSPCNTTINSRKELFHAIGKMIPLVREEVKKEMPTRPAAKSTKKGKGKGKKNSFVSWNQPY
ncbi:hypothetical protein JH06_4201 [Blastocystis sp. subtype 4]|uniref:hypothetical protein n=1 Tax=Blastocystis sp. subtype 4 TaxID=944170 RepID=UPI0007112AC1|nr:hypothetical protein JH06_4201 [Blastocystis sp. subtype 4]KNB42213.1 hypothetical protein JH06_4201 [Blastocystis sp. subtype 4]|eukprot:XP_014525656.1 hypothetical protein JH06_4201 [Blastocystis sp. subtype 4]